MVVYVVAAGLADALRMTSNFYEFTYSIYIQGHHDKEHPPALLEVSNIVTHHKTL